MSTTRELRAELKALSKEVFGVSSKWQSMLTYNQTVTRKTVETVPGENGAPDTQREVEVPLLVNGKVRQTVEKRRTPEEVLVILKDLKTKLDTFKLEQENKRKEAEEAKLRLEAQQKVQNELAGSSNR